MIPVGGGGVTIKLDIWARGNKAAMSGVSSKFEYLYEFEPTDTHIRNRGAGGIVIEKTEVKHLVTLSN
jgi:hypothetical protein